MTNLEIPLSVKYYTNTFTISNEVHSQSHIPCFGEVITKKKMITKGEAKKKK